MPEADLCSLGAQKLHKYSFLPGVAAHYQLADL